MPTTAVRASFVKVYYRLSLGFGGSDVLLASLTASGITAVLILVINHD